MLKEKQRSCIICGSVEAMSSFICGACRAKIQRDVLGKQNRIEQQAGKALNKFGEYNNQLD